MIVGFTGTRRGMTEQQRVAIMTFFHDNDVTEGHHGDCIGSDEQFHDICLVHDVPVVIHPPEDDKLRAFCEGAREIMPPRPYLDRNHIIVDRCNVLLAAPKESEEPAAARGQGTWSTVRYARRSERVFMIVWPEA